MCCSINDGCIPLNKNIADFKNCGLIPASLSFVFTGCIIFSNIFKQLSHSNKEALHLKVSNLYQDKERKIKYK